MSIKLNSSMRESIVKQMLAHRFTKEVVALEKEHAALAQAVYDDLYPRKVRGQIDALPEGWLKTGNSIEAQFGARYDNMYFSGAFGSFSAYGIRGGAKYDGSARRFLAKSSGRAAKAYPVGHKMTDRYEALESKRSELQNRIREAQRQITVAVDRVTTTGALIKAWPEAEPFVPKAAIPPALPAIPIKDLNKILDLPVTERNAA